MPQFGMRGPQASEEAASTSDEKARLLDVEASEGETLSDDDLLDDDDGFLANLIDCIREDKRCQRLRRGCKCCSICCVCVLTILIIVGFLVPWGKGVYNEDLKIKLRMLGQANSRVTSACMYKQANNGPGFSVRIGTGYWQDDGKDRSADILYYHHQGNLLEWLHSDNTTEWMQISFNEKYGMMYFMMQYPMLPDVIRWTKECFIWCGTVSLEQGTPYKFIDWIDDNGHRRYNGFLLNCLQFSQGLFDFFAPSNVGCMPKKRLDMAEHYVGNNPKPTHRPISNHSSIR